VYPDGCSWAAVMLSLTSQAVSRASGGLSRDVAPKPLPALYFEPGLAIGTQAKAEG
jgi:hypothetical protein